MSKRVKNWLPNQHGAWAFLITPILYALLASEFTFNIVLILFGWLLAYSFNFYFGLAFKTKNFSKWKNQLIFFGTISLLIATFVLSRNFEIFSIAPILLVGFLINLYFVKTKNERAFLNDLVGVVLSAFIAYHAAKLSNLDLREETLIRNGLLIISMYFIGTIFYVKTMIRERGHLSWLFYSYAWHILLVGVSFRESTYLGYLSIILLFRAWYFPYKRFKPKTVGLIEFLFTVILLLLLLTK